MSQAETAIITSRRDVLAGAGAVGALTLPTTATYADVEQDGELITLGKELHVAIKEWLPLNAKSGELGDISHDLAWSRVGIPEGRHPTREEASHLIAELTLAERETGWGPIGEASDQAMKRIEQITRRIEKLAATTREGLAAKALVVAYQTYCSCDIWERDVADLEFPVRGTRQLIESCLNVAGVANPFAEAQGLSEYRTVTPRG